MKNSSYLYNKAGAAVAAATTFYVEVPVRADGSIGAQISWLDAVSAATITLELSNYGMADVAYDAAAAHYWADSGVSIMGPNATAIGSTILNIDNVRQKRGRLKFVTTAASIIQVLGAV